MKGLESCGGREAAGCAHLSAIKAESDNMQSPQPPRWWIEQMANVLRDESSGICFRDRYGFCSTGSQISWLPSMADQGDRCRGKEAFHFFTGASDPLCGTPYKLFLFSDPISNCGKGENTHDHDTRQLWDMWRKRALSRAVMTMPLSEALTTIEEEGLSTLGRDETACTRSTFEQMVQREMKLLENGCE